MLLQYTLPWKLAVAKARDDPLFPYVKILNENAVSLNSKFATIESK